MNQQAGRNDNLEQLLSLLVDGQCSPDQWEELRRLLDGNVEMQTRYLEFMNLHGQLIWRLSADLPTAMAGGDSAAEPGGTSGRPPQSTRLGKIPPRPGTGNTSPAKPGASPRVVSRAAQPSAPRGRFLDRPLPRFLLSRGAPPWVVAGVIALGIAVWLSWAAGAPATMTRSMHAVWDPAHAAAAAEPLAAGRHLVLNKGWAEITFTSGAKVTLQGPAALTITNSNAARLEAGQLAVDVPPSATGFTLDVPSGRIIDRGTQFGVIVDKADANQEATVEVHVLKGRVDMETGGRDGSGFTVTKLAINEAVRSSTANQSLQRMPAEPDKFVTSLNEPVAFQRGDIVVNGPARTIRRVSDGAIFAGSVHPRNDISSLAFHADGTALYAIERRWKGSIGPTSQLIRIDLTNPENPQVVGRLRWGTSLVAAPDGMILACDAQPRHSGPQIVAFDPAHNYRRKTLAVLPGEFRGLVVSPAGDIYVAVANHFVAQLDRSTGALIPVIEDIDPSGLLFDSATGELLVAVSPSAGAMELHRYAPAGRPATLRGTLALSEMATLHGFTADGLILATPHHGKGLWQIDPRDGRLEIIHPQAVSHLAIYQPEL